MFNFDKDATQLVSDYIEEFETLLGESKVELDPRYVKIVLPEIKSSIEFYCVKQWSKRNAEAVEVDDVKYVLERFGEPRKLLERFLKPNVQRNTLENLDFMKEVLCRSNKPKVLDAGCGWGRYLKRLRKQGIVNLEMVGVDLEPLSLLYGKVLMKRKILRSLTL